MLVLSRKYGQSIVFTGPDDVRIEVDIVEVGAGARNKGQVKIGITAPESVNVIRKEIEGRTR